ncbi:MAG TPA: outer membrane beta-barrel protein, partial [Cyclobacteriaceae bacterium]|nr:outer membrane beta-barrel protein [Cyclobacteriaceae bacterium]
LSVSGRLEYFEDRDEVHIDPITGVAGFETYSSSLGLNYKVADNILIRTEGRSFFSNKQVYERNGEAVKNSNLITTNVTLWF